MKSDNYKAMRDKISRAECLVDLEKAETSLDRLYNAGVFDVKEYQKLDGFIFDKIIKLEMERAQ